MAKAAGLWLGDTNDIAVFEDSDIVQSIEPHPELAHRFAIAIRNLHHPVLAFRGPDVRSLQAKIALRNARFQKWGFKRPNIVPILGSSGLSLFRNP